MPTKPQTSKKVISTNSESINTVAVRADLSSSEFSLPFTHFVTVPKNTAQANPYTLQIRLPIGVIKRLWVEFPRGCMGLVGIQIYRAVEQIFPIPAGGWFRSDAAVYDFNFTHYIKSEPYEVILCAYNLDDTYQHTVHITLEMTGFIKDIPSGLMELLAIAK